MEIAGDQLGDQVNWLVESLEVKVMVFEGRALGVELPPSVEVEVTETAPQPKSATATNQLKEATVETGARIRVPPFIENGQRVKVNTETGEYLGKA
jgi:elongation factor P